ncbi:hypothetical protein LEM8419_00182 [Neolewinella maritima]|uniref:Uncharacterized protein n=1 Tax=Neolewinella maritima TaxID=1383882 RepID=A0ABN8F276_9BACT|nr:hypothetical protein [Neolewinella maritima]CAH0998867.1 hypothetical protein LEM8419_00182 [Neolewinella maritima]
MRQLILFLLLAGTFTACTPEAPAEEGTAETSSDVAVTTDENEQEAAWTDITSDEARIATALLAAPEASRSGAKVIGYNAAGELVTLREGTNEFICLADDPGKDGFNAACYHRDLEPFMARGRELKAEGKTPPEIDAIREAEVKDKTLAMAPTGATLHIYYGPEVRYDPTTGEVEQAKYRYVVYMPYATAASTGLPESPVAPNHPWIMDPGTHRAHIMISPL